MLNPNSPHRLSVEGQEAFNRKDFTSAAALWEQARTIYQAQGNDEMAAMINQNLGVAYLNTRRLDRALARTEEARQFYNDCDSVVDVAETDQNRGNILVAMGQFDEAFELYEAAREAFHCNEVAAKVAEVDQCIAIGHLKRGNIYRSREQYKDAIADFALARDIFRDYEADMREIDRAIAELQALQSEGSEFRAGWQEQETDLLPDPASDTAAIQQLWEEFQRDPRIGTHLLQVFDKTLERLAPPGAQILRVTLLHDMGSVYARSPIGDPGTNLSQAIACLREAQGMLSPEDPPALHANIQIDLGETYRRLPLGDRGVNLANAIACARAALGHIKLEEEPILYAMAKNNLGTAYGDLPPTAHKLNLVWASECFKEAMRIYKQEADEVRYARSLSNLGNMYQRLGKLKQAIECYQEALDASLAETASREYAGIQLNLGNSYAELTTGNREENSRKALACYREASSFFTPDTAPYEYAVIQLNLGNIYRPRPESASGQDPEQSIDCYRKAMSFLKPDTFPLECRQTGRNLGDLLFDARRWSEAHAAYEVAIRAAEKLYASAFMDSSRSIETGETMALYMHDAFCLAQTGQIAESIMRLETGKTRIMSERLGREAVQLQQAAPEDRAEYLRLTRQLKELETQQQASLMDSGQPAISGQVYVSTAEKVAQTRRELQVLSEQISGPSGEFLPAPIDLNRLPALLQSEQTALVLPCVTRAGSVLFVIRSQADPIAVWCEGFTQADLKRLMLDASDKVLAWFEFCEIAERHEYPTGRENIMSEIAESQGQYQAGWLQAYRLLQITSDQAQAAAHAGWLAAMEQVLAEIGRRLIAPLYAELQKYDLSQLVLIPQGSLFFLPLHAAPLNPEGVCLIDRYRVSYAPSIKVFQHCQEQARHARADGFFAVSNPTDDLDLADSEVAAIAESFQADVVVLRSGDATKEKVLAQASGYGYVHFSCHGKYDWEEPYHSALFLSGYPKNVREGSALLQEQRALTLAEVQAKMDLRQTRLITLSACETGLSEAIGYRAEEFIGLPAGFLLAGVSGVVSSLWPVPALATALLMEQFYWNHRNKKMDPASALREAQIRVRAMKCNDVAAFAEKCYQRSDENNVELLRLRNHYRYQAEREPDTQPFGNPYFWAAFTLNGV